MTKKIVEDQKKIITEDVVKVDLGDHAELAYLEYAMSVVKGRAIPWVEDGLKPVQRRILYAMKELNLGHNNKPKKSARVVGDVIGKYHPHGDGAVYEAMVRTAQDFSLRYPLVIGEGNFGSRDGDPAAAMRYTEARLSAFSDTFLQELDMGTVDWRTNYDNTMQEPDVLPSRLPNILLNGSSGIGVGIATEIPAHNLNEVLDACVFYIKNPKATLENIFDFIKGPDFPTGGSIISSQEEIYKAYTEGRGSIRLRSTYHIEGEGSKNWKIVFDELPYGVSAQKIMEEIDALLNPKSKEKNGKKIFTPEQLRLKGVFSNLIDKFTDASDKDHALRLVFEPKSYKQDPQEIIQSLLAYTSLETNYSLNLVVVGRDKSPRRKNLLEIVSEWADFRIHTVYRRTKYEHEVASKRLHILQGRLTILDHIEEVVQIIKSADNPKQALIDRFGLSEIQADDVLEIRLRQLARLEKNKIEDEIRKLEAEIKRLQKLLDSNTALKNQVIKELEEDRKKFADNRRTQITPSEKTLAKQVEEQIMSEEPVTVSITERGWLRVKPGHVAQDNFGTKTGDTPKYLFHTTNLSHLIFIDDTGKSYCTHIKDIPMGKSADDIPIATLADFSKKPNIIFSAKPNDRYVLATSAGYGFICNVSDMLTRQKAGKNLITLDENDKVISPVKIPENIDLANITFGIKSSNHRVLLYRLSEINQLPKGKGVALCGLDNDCQLEEICIFPKNSVQLLLNNGKNITLSNEEFVKHFQSRSSSKKGKPVDSVKGKPFKFYDAQ